MLLHQVCAFPFILVLLRVSVAKKFSPGQQGYRPLLTRLLTIAVMFWVDNSLFTSAFKHTFIQRAMTNRDVFTRSAAHCLLQRHM